MIFFTSGSGELSKKCRAWAFPILFVVLILSLTGCGRHHHRPPCYDREFRDVTTCFYDFTDVYNKRIRGVLGECPGVVSVQRLWSECAIGEACVCYALEYCGSIDRLSGCIQKRLPLNRAVPFRMVPVSPSRLEVYFDGGFE